MSSHPTKSNKVEAVISDAKALATELSEASLAEVTGGRANALTTGGTGTHDDAAAVAQLTTGGTGVHDDAAA